MEDDELFEGALDDGSGSGGLGGRGGDFAGTDSEELERILDVNVGLTVELGRRRIRISEVLSLTSGSVVEFHKSADEPLDIRINDQLVARGEAVVIGDRYGVRVTEVVSPNERLQSSGLIKEAS